MTNLHNTVSTACVVFGAIIIAALCAPAAEARDRNGQVKVCSSYGNGCYSAPVRRSKWGHEMRLKGGTWIDCRGDCRQTLREETIDFWETQNDKALAIP